MKHDAQGRRIIGAPWSAVSGVPALLTEFGALNDPGQDASLEWDDTTNSLVWAPVSASSLINIVLPRGTSGPINLFEMAGAPVSAATVSLLIPIGARILSSDNLVPALDLRGFPAASIINITNLGKIMGRGGAGGNGGVLARSGGEEDFAIYPRAGDPGSAAIVADANITLNITNTTGFIWGGGGGGGAGGGSTDNGSTAATGGGGGGAGSGAGGQGIGHADLSSGSPTFLADSAAGSRGTLLATSAGGAGGAGAQAGGGATGGAGGAGGDWGTVGAVGTSPTTYSSDIAAPAGGAAGAALVPGGATVVWSGGDTSPNVKGAIT